MQLKRLPVILLLLCQLFFPSVAKASDMEVLVKQETNSFGEPITVRYYRLSEPPVFRKSPTLAQLHWLWNKLDNLPPDAMKLIMSCPINDMGQVNLSFCKPERGPHASRQQKITDIIIYTTAPILPEFDVIANSDSSKVERRVSFPLVLDPSTKPEIDISAGRMVAKSQIGFSKFGGIKYYPPSAANRGIGGQLTMTCQVQLDLSIICNAIDFDPPEHLKYFHEVAERSTLFSKVRANLSDGSSAAGVRTKMTLKFKTSR